MVYLYLDSAKLDAQYLRKEFLVPDVSIPVYVSIKKLLFYLENTVEQDDNGRFGFLFPVRAAREVAELENIPRYLKECIENALKDQQSPNSTRPAATDARSLRERYKFS